MTIRVTSKRINSSKAVLRQYGVQAERVIAVAGNMVRNTAVQGIQAHGSSGVTYQKYNPRRTHTASVAGAYPNTDTGYLVSNIHLVIDDDKLGASVESRAEYSEYLEFGTSKMQARPFMQPSLEENRAKIVALFKRLKARGGN